MTLTFPARDVQAAADVLRRGGLVAMPTETVYGLAADAFDEAAIARVFTAKGRPADDPLIVHVTRALTGDDPWGGLVDAGLVSPHAPAAQVATARVLLAACTPGPLTLVLPRGPRVSGAVTSGLPDVALRFPAHPVAIALIDAVGRPLVAPSANRFGRISPTDAAAVSAELDGRIDAILDGGPCGIGVESTVARVEADGTVTVLRPGAVGLDALSIGGEVRVAARHEGSGGSPGRLASHYAPRAPLALVDGPPATWSAARLADLRARVGHGAWHHVAWTGDAAPVEAAAAAATGLRPQVHVLSPDGRSDAAARNLYAVLRAADDAHPALLTLEAPPATDALGHALADRLARAAHGTRPLA